ncbi:MAG: SpoIIE family protein phosphatase [Terracidiphilus sp.]
MNVLALGSPRRWRRLRYFAVTLFVACAADVLPAQTFDATNLRAPVDLGATWLVHAGDDPAYARPDFDDSQWTPFDSHSDIKRLFPSEHPEVVWYRLRVKVSPDETGLGLKEQSISKAYEVYVNGERLVASGSIVPYAPYTMNAWILKPIPDGMVASGALVIALRVHISQLEWAAQGPGFVAQNLTLGQRDTLYRDDWLGIIGQNAVVWLDRLFAIGLGVVALVLYSAQRRQTEYLWVFAACLLSAIEAAVPFITTFHDIPQAWQLPVILFRAFAPYIMVSMYFAFVHQRIGWRWRIVLIVSGLMNVYSGIQLLYFIAPLQLQFISNLPFIVLLSVVVPIVLVIHWRRGNHEAGILLIPVTLFSFYLYTEIALDTMFQFPATRNAALRGLALIDRFPADPFTIPLNYVSGILSSLSLAIIMLLRSSTMSRRQAIIESELAAAKEVQKVLLPDHRGIVPGFTIDSVYEPAQQVGGDFFQVVPVGDGGLVIVFGDVAGKGLPAAMLVSVLVGAIFGLSEYTKDPAELLAGLNERLVGRSGGGFSTALAAHIAANGAVTIANAGHLSPYLDGEEVELPAALPLGVLNGVKYETMEFSLAPGSRLTFYSDGVIEAQNQHGELFGFGRAKAISTQPAAAIVEAAKKFGQEDDITVVTVVREEAIASAA